MLCVMRRVLAVMVMDMPHTNRKIKYLSINTIHSWICSETNKLWSSCCLGGIAPIQHDSKCVEGRRDVTEGKTQQLGFI